MAEQLEFEFVIDDSDAKKKYDALEKQGKDAAKKISDTFAKEDSLGEKKVGKLKEGLDNSADASGKLGSALVSAGVKLGGILFAADKLKDAFVFIANAPFEGEKLNALEAQFNRLASDAGLVGPELLNGLETASRGLTDVGDLLSRANSAVINLGESASKLPEILDLARRVTSTLGGDIGDRFEGITRAIETGNARLLKQNGIVLDTEAVFKKYAGALGLTANELTEANRKQAILEATLEKGREKFKDVEGSVRPLTESTQQLSVAFKNLFDDLGKSIADSQATGFFAKLTSSAASAVNNFSSFLTGNIKKDVGSLNTEIEKVQGQISKLNRDIQILGPAVPPASIELMNIYQRRLANLNAEFQKTQGFLEKSTTLPGTAGSVNDDAEDEVKKTPAQIAAIKARKDQIMALELQSNAASLAASVEQARLIGDVDTRSFVEKENQKQKLLQLEQQKNLDISKANAQFSADASFTEEQRGRVRNAIIQKYNADVANAEREFLTSRQRQMQEFQNALGNILVQQTAKAFATLGEALNKGPKAFENFAGQMFSILGDLAIQTGITISGLGAALQTLAIALASPFAGGSAIVAGAALIAIGVGLKALASANGAGGSAASGGGSSGGGGGFTGGTDTLTPTAPEDVQAAEPKTTISVNVNGNILGTSDRSLGLAISEILSDQFSSQGLVLKG